MIGPVYVVTDPAAPLPVIEQARAAARGGAWAVQLRDKTASDAELNALAVQLMGELGPLGVKLIINDRLEVAISAAAHGLHIGQSDGDPALARKRLGQGRILGLSVTSLVEARAVPPVVDYVGVGPVRSTLTKPDHAEPIGFAGLAAIVAALPVPAIAIGGIGREDVPALKAAGVAGMAVVSAVVGAPDPEVATRELLHRWSQS
jgi:thiamine-phosphate pyrophosphorylase